jgi:hypothetical protein
MKKKRTSIMIIAGMAALISFGIWSCSKDHSSSSSSVTLTEANAAQVTTDAVSPETGGLVSQISASATLGAGVVVNGVRKPVIESLPCGNVKDTTIVYTSLLATPGYSYKLAWEFKTQCTVQPNITLNFTGTGTYSGLVLGSQFNSSGSFVLSGLDSADYTYNSNFSRSGIISSKTGAQTSYSHSLSIISTNIKYDPVAQEIVSGTATVSIKLTNTAGNTFSYSGTITFEGGKTAKLVLNSGTVYNISWS